MATGNKRRGIKNVTINQRPFRFVPGSISMNLARENFTNIEGSGGSFTSAVNDPSVTLSVYLECDDRVDDFTNLCDTTVSIDEHNGRVTTLINAAQVGQGDNYNPDTGELSLTFTAEDYVQLNNCN